MRLVSLTAGLASGRDLPLQMEMNAKGRHRSRISVTLAAKRADTLPFLLGIISRKVSFHVITKTERTSNGTLSGIQEIDLNVIG